MRYRWTMLRGRPRKAEEWLALKAFSCFSWLLRNSLSGDSTASITPSHLRRDQHLLSKLAEVEAGNAGMSFKYDELRTRQFVRNDWLSTATKTGSGQQNSMETQTLEEEGARTLTGWNFSKFQRTERQTGASNWHDQEVTTHPTTDGGTSTTTVVNDSGSVWSMALYASGTGPIDAISFDSYVRESYNNGGSSQYTSWSTSGGTGENGDPVQPTSGSSSSGSGGGSSMRAELSSATTALQTLTSWSSASPEQSVETATVAISVDPPPAPMDGSLVLLQTGSALVNAGAMIGGELREVVGLGGPADRSKPLGGNTINTLSATLLKIGVKAPEWKFQGVSWDNLAKDLQRVLGNSAHGSAAPDAQLHALWIGLLENGLQNWQAIQPEVMKALEAGHTLDKRLAELQKQMPAELLPTQPPPPPTRSRDALQWASNFFAAWADTLTGGITQKIRSGLGYDDVVDKNSYAYGYGTSVGTIHNALLMVFGGNVTGWAAGALQRINAVAMVGGTIHGVEALANGDVAGAAMALSGVVLTGMRGSNICAVAKFAQTGLKVMHGVTAATRISSGFDKFAEGDYLGGFADFVDAGANAFMMGKACFVAGTPILTPEGSRCIEELKVGDYVFSRDENDPNGPIVPKRIEETFVRAAFVLNLTIRGQVIGTTAEHPLYSMVRGWTSAGLLQVGEFVLGGRGEWLEVEGVAPSPMFVPVYNIRVADYRTYFVAAQEWDFSVWAHNTCYEVKLHNGKLTLFEIGAAEPVRWNPTSGKSGPRTFDSRQQAAAQLKKINNGAAPDVELPLSRQRASKRRLYMGQNPKKTSTTYKDVLARMERDGEIHERGGIRGVLAADGEFVPLDKADLVHRTDAMKWWNTEGKYWGAKHPKVLEWMADPHNYTIGKPGPNRSAGAKLKDIGYDLPDPRPGGPPQ